MEGVQKHDRTRWAIRSAVAVPQHYFCRRLSSIGCVPWLSGTVCFHLDFRPPARDRGDDPGEAGRWSPRIRLQPQCEQVSEAERRRNMQPVVKIQPHADCEHRRHEAFQRVGGARQRRVRLTEMTLEPDMHARLVAHLDSAPQRLGKGDTVIAGEHVDVKPGNAMPVANIPVGTIVHNIELKIGKGGQIARSAGSYAQIVGRDGEYVILRLNSGEQRLVHGRCIATVGAMSNPDNMNVSIGKAGRNRWLGWRGHVRGETMNTVDHPLGGRTRGGRHPVTPWGKPTKGMKTRKNKSTGKFIMLSRHARKKKK